MHFGNEWFLAGSDFSIRHRTCSSESWLFYTQSGVCRFAAAFVWCAVHVHAWSWTVVNGWSVVSQWSAGWSVDWLVGFVGSSWWRRMLLLLLLLIEIRLETRTPCGGGGGVVGYVIARCQCRAVEHHSFIHPFIHFFIATNVKTHSPLHMTKTYYDYVTR